jgi:hypothetical protein
MKISVSVDGKIIMDGIKNEIFIKLVRIQNLLAAVDSDTRFRQELCAHR